MLQIGSVVDGKYKILSKIGQGGMSVVYMAINERANKTWAIKEIRRDGVQDYEVVKQGLIVETDLLKRLSHPNLPSIIDVIEEQDSFLIVMDYIEGKPLSSALRDYGAQDQNQVIKWAKQLCDVLSYLHSREPAIIYRDMKPSNVMLKPDGNVTLIDFGIAREFKKNHVADTTCLGTRGYAAPEQYGGQGQTDARTDIYCLGATMYHLLTGHNPSEPPYEMYPIRYWNPNLSSGLEEIILKCTQANPNDRFQSCAELMFALEHYTELDDEYRRRQKRRWVSFLASAAMTIGLGAGAFGFNRAEEAARQDSYDYYRKSASQTQDMDEKYDLYMEAISIKPSEEETYLDVLNEFLLDSVFDSEEQEMFRKMMGASSGEERTNESYLQVNESGYHELCRDAAMAYFYYTESDQKSAALPWLLTVKDSKYLPASDVDRADLLYTIASYYSNVGKINKAGDSTVSYGVYWQDLVESTSENLVSRDNAMTAMVMYRELVNQINMNCSKFRDAGITQEDMSAQLDNVESRLQTDVKTEIDSTVDSDSRELLTETYNKIMDNIANARKLSAVVYGENNRSATAATTSGEGGE